MKLREKVRERSIYWFSPTKGHKGQGQDLHQDSLPWESRVCGTESPSSAFPGTLAGIHIEKRAAQIWASTHVGYHWCRQRLIWNTTTLAPWIPLNTHSEVGLIDHECFFLNFGELLLIPVMVHHCITPSIKFKSCNFPCC